MTPATTEQNAALHLGAFVEVTSPTGTGQAVSWTGYVCVVDGRRANVTAHPGPGAMAVQLTSPDVRLVTAADPAIATCAACQEQVAGMRGLCEVHWPLAIR